MGQKTGSAKGEVQDESLIVCGFISGKLNRIRDIGGLLTTVPIMRLQSAELPYTVIHILQIES